MSESALPPMAQDTAPLKLDFDPDVLRTRYRQERDQRLRSDGNDQYREVAGDFSHYIDDPYVEPGFTRAPLHDEVEVLIIGGGFGGLLAGARLREAGIKDIRIIEKGGDFGGTWYWNRYPGAQCDIEAYIYLPLLEEVGYIPKEKYSHAPEILKHARAIGEKFDLYRNACFQTTIKDLRWDDGEHKWTITTHRNDRMKARFVVMSNGPLNRPKLPALPGIERFKGHTFHTSRWDYHYTGGDSTGNLHKLADKRVAIIGTGATAIQCVPYLGRYAQQLTVFQRTLSSVDVRGNRPTDPLWARSLQPGWQRRRMDNFNILVGGGHQDEDLVADGWTDIIRNLAAILPVTRAETAAPEEMARMMELADFKKMNEVRARVDTVVHDPATAEALKPWYRQFCKRPCFHDDYLPTFNRPNVTLVDTHGLGVDQLSEKGVVIDGKEYEVDCLIFATGFEVGVSYTRRTGYEMIGRDGLKLSQKWGDGIRTLYGLQTHGFPNAFFLGFTQTAFTFLVPFTLNEQAKHIAYLLQQVKERDAGVIEATQQAEDDWCAEMASKAHLGDEFYKGCTPGYYNNEGDVQNRFGVYANMYGGGPMKFLEILDQWRKSGNLAGEELR